MYGLKEEKKQLFNMIDDINGSTNVRADKSNGILPDQRIQRGICWFHPPDVVFRLSWLTSIRGSENVHIYLWILKDLSWAQSWWIPGHVFGIAAVLWSFYILSHAVRDRNTNEIMTNFSTFMWLFGNTWWMIGDIHDHNFPEEPAWYPQRTIDCRNIMVAALCLLGAYYLIVKPLKLFNVDNPDAMVHYDRTGLKPRWPISLLFKTWREYENVHILFWLGKDCAWNRLIPSMWFVFVLPTLGIMLDLACTSFFAKPLLIDHAHYSAQFVWVIANAIWAGGELFTPDYDFPFPLVTTSSEARQTARWYSSWTLVAAFVPLVVMYILWAFYTVTGRIRESSLHQSHIKPSMDPEDGGVHDDVEGSSSSSSYSSSTGRGCNVQGMGANTTSVEAVHITIVGGDDVIQQQPSSSSSSTSASHTHPPSPLSTQRYGATSTTDSNKSNNSNHSNHHPQSPGNHSARSDSRDSISVVNPLQVKLMDEDYLASVTIHTQGQQTQGQNSMTNGRLHNGTSVQHTGTLHNPHNNNNNTVHEATL